MGTPLGPPPGDGPYGQQPYGQQPYGQQPYGQPRKVRPGRIWYLVALLVFLGGVAWLVIGLLALSSQIDSFQRVPVPQGGQVSLDHTGGYVIYYEGPGASSGNVPRFQIRVIPASSGAAVQSLETYSGSVTYTFGSHEGRAELTLQVGHPGRFAIEVPGSPSLPANADLAFGAPLAGGIVGIALPTVLLMLAGLAGLVVIFVIRIVKTSRARSAALPRPPPPGPQFPGPPPTGPQPPAQPPTSPYQPT